MKIFSNFDTKLDDELYADAVEKFGQSKVLFVRRDRIYMILKVWIRLWLRFAFSTLVLLAYYVFLWWETWFWRFVWWLVWLIVVILWLWIGYICVQKMIDYYMDYSIITPTQVIQYDQTWILTRSARSLDITKIKSINIKKVWLLCSIFDYWSIVFFSEWDQWWESAHWDIKLNYISKPIMLKDTIISILDLHSLD